MFRKKREKLYIPLIMNIYFNDNGNTRFFVPVRGIIVILSKLTANKKREGAEGRFSEEITCRFLAGGSLMKFKKHLSFVACAEQARRNLENKHRRGARDAISPGPSS